MHLTYHAAIVLSVSFLTFSCNGSSQGAADGEDPPTSAAVNGPTAEQNEAAAGAKPPGDVPLAGEIPDAVPWKDDTRASRRVSDSTPPPTGGDELVPLPADGSYPSDQTGYLEIAGSRRNYPNHGSVVIQGPVNDKTQFHTRVFDQGDSLDLAMIYRDNGVYVKASTQRYFGIETNCRFAEPLPIVALPPAPERRFSGTADCIDSTLKVDGREEKSEPIALDGVQYEAVRVVQRFTMTGQLASEGTQTDWFVPDLGLSVRSQMKAEGTWGDIPFAWSIELRLPSAVPTT